MPDFDVVVVGSGPGGATAADVLTEEDRSVCILEKGRNHLLALDAPFPGLGRMSNDEVKFGRRHFLGPDPLLEPRSYRRSAADGERTTVGDVNNMPSTLGGAGFHADGKLPRYREVDFRLRSELGPVEGAEVADWPVDYAEMEPFYDEAERSIGVAGDHTGNPFAAWRSGPYPMPPGADMFLTTLTVPASERLGYHPYRAPTGVNSVEYDGRPACNNCGFCAFYGCPIEAKGDPVAMLRRSLGAGRARSDRRASRWRSCSTAAGSAPKASATSTPTVSNTSSPRVPSSSPAARSKRRGFSCAAESATRPTSSAGI